MENPLLIDYNVDGVPFSQVTLRDLFACFAVQGMLTADAMLKAREVSNA